MILRLLFLLGFTLGFSAQAMACSCVLWGSGNISEYVEDYVTVWAVPTKGDVRKAQTEWEDFNVFYELDVLESFSQVPSGKIIAISPVVDGASCGVQLTLGNPQLLSLYKLDDGHFGLSICTPEMPYKALKNYLKTGKDVLVPNKSYCIQNEKRVNTEDEVCKVWQEEPAYNHRYGQEDSFKYLKIWQNRIKEEPVLTKKPWWKLHQKK